MTESTTSFSPLRSSIFAISGLLAILFDILFWDRGLQLNVTFFVALYAVLFIAAAYHFKHIRNTWALGLFVAAIAIASTKTLYTNDFSVFVATPLAGAFLFLGSIFLTAQHSSVNKIEFLRTRALRSIMLWVDVIEDIAAYILRPVFSAKRYTSHFLYLLFGLVIAVPLIVIFVVLFQSADPLFKEFVSNLFLIDITNIIE